MPEPRKLDLSFRPKTYWRTRNSASAARPETEIVRIAVSSSSRDAISLKARRDSGGRLRYRMLHEDAFGRTRHAIRVKPASSAEPLTMGELIALLESACYAGPCPDEGDDERYGGVIWGTLRLSLEHGIDHAEDYLFFLRITSDHYPRLERYYFDRVGEWCLAHCIEEDDCRRIVRLRRGRFPRKLVSL
jgi:hypothetical protein